MVNVKCVAAAGLTVSCCVAEVRLPVAAVSVGVPAVESLYWKLTVPAPAEIVKGDTGENMPVAELVLKLTVAVLAALTTFPKASSKATVIVPEVTPATRVCGDVVKAKWPTRRPGGRFPAA